MASSAPFAKNVRTFLEIVLACDRAELQIGCQAVSVAAGKPSP
jgi:hypothetical protein